MRFLAPDPRRKIPWAGDIVAVQPRIRLIRSFDERSHAYLGFVLALDGLRDGMPQRFTVGVGPAAHAKHRFQVGGRAEGIGERVMDVEREPADVYKTAKLRYIPPRTPPAAGPPWTDLAPDLHTYRERGHRRLAATTYATTCRSCKWGCRMTVDLILDHWQPDIREHRTETFCYGPKSCALYRPGPTRKVPGRKRGMSYEEENWVDDEATGHRGPHD
jgi:hypothetical protein